MPITHLKVKLLAKTPYPQEVVSMGARLCYSDAGIDELQNAGESPRLIRALMDMGHMSPIEHASFTFGIEGVSRALLAQITRHRIASFSVQSQRYVCQSKNKEEFDYILPPAIEALGEEAVLEYKKQMNTMQKWYQKWIERLGDGGEESNEDARFVLPGACETKMIVTMNARELLHFFSIRCCNRAQWEIRALAWEMLKIVKKEAPVLFGSAGPSCVRGGCSEGKMTCGMAAEVKRRHEELST
jgi:thymidylate synthase (FAD)